jgi:hypothetical protein
VVELLNTEVNNASTSRHAETFQVNKMDFKTIESNLQSHFQERIRVLSEAMDDSNSTF